MRWDQAQGLDGLMAKLTACEKKVGRLISQYSILLHLCPPPHLPSWSAPSPLFHNMFHLCLFTLVLLQFLSYEAHIGPFLTPTPLSLMPCFL